ncbi:hypothetical protein V7O66_13965 [Methanolobus sp. ZRKC3]
MSVETLKVNMKLVSCEITGICGKAKFQIGDDIIEEDFKVDVNISII